MYKTDTCIIGGGVMGLATAYFQVKSGKKVILLEKDGIGSGASGSCDDMILLQSKKPGIALTLAIESLEIYRSLESELNSEIGFMSRGGMVLIEDNKQLAVMEVYVKQQISQGLDVIIVGKNELKKRQPHVAPSIIASTYSPTDSQVDPMLLMRALLRYSNARGMQVLRKSAPLGIDKKGDHWAVDIPGGKVECDAIVFAAGAWSKSVGELIGIDIPISPRRGQIAITEQIPIIGETNAWTAAYIASKLDKSLMPDKGPFAKEIGLGFSFSQTHDGNYLIGSTREDAGFDKTTNERALSIVVKQALEYFPVLKSTSIIRTMAGFRPATPDGSPIVGAVDGFDGIFIASGHEGDGIALSPVTGRAVSSMINGTFNDARYDELNLRRFANIEV